MPAVKPSPKVLVSGANGYIAVWLVRTLLEQGFSVRGTVRSKEKSAFLFDLFKSYGDKFELVTVQDITKEGAFDEAVKGVDAIQHTASPFHFDADDPKELIEPAVNGTVGILKSAVKNAPDLKRIIVLSSCAAVMHFEKEPVVLNESDWNDQSTEEVERLGRGTPQSVKYRASKTLAEKAAWAFYREHEKKVNWDLVVINPPFVFGPFLHPVSSPQDLNTSAKEWYQTVVVPQSSGKSNEHLATTGSSWVDVRDIATALSKSLVVAEAGNERIIVSAVFLKENFIGKIGVSGRVAFKLMIYLGKVDVANSLALSPVPTKTLPVGDPGAGKKVPHRIEYDTSKGSRILELEYRSMEESARDILVDFERRGW